MSKYDFTDLKKGSAKGLLVPKKQAKGKAPTSRLTVSTVKQVPGMPSIIVKGQGRRQNTKPITLPIPNEIYEKVKAETNISAGLVALMTYAVERLDAEGETLLAEYSAASASE